MGAISGTGVWADNGFLASLMTTQGWTTGQPIPAPVLQRELPPADYPEVWSVIGEASGWDVDELDVTFPDGSYLGDERPVTFVVDELEFAASLRFPYSYTITIHVPPEARAEEEEREEEDIDVADALAEVQAHRRSLGQTPLDPRGAGWTEQDVLDEAGRIRRLPNHLMPPERTA